MRTAVFKLVLLAAAGFGANGAAAEEITGLGRTLDEAKDDARRHVGEKLLDKLEGRDPPRTSWRPTPADLDAFIQGPGRAGKVVDVGGLAVVHEWILSVQFPSDGELERRDRQASRQRIAAMSVAGMIGLCGIWLAAVKWRRWATAR